MVNFRHSRATAEPAGIAGNIAVRAVGLASLIRLEKKTKYLKVYSKYVLNVLATLKAVRSPGVGLVIFSELSATVMIGGVLIKIQVIGGVLIIC